MKVNTIMPYLFTAQRRTFTEQQDDLSGGVVRDYDEQTSTINVRLVLSTQSRPIMYCPERLKPFDLITDILDINGVQVIDSDFYISGFLPVANAYGFSDGYAYQIKLVPKGGLGTAVTPPNPGAVG